MRLGEDSYLSKVLNRSQQLEDVEWVFFGSASEFHFKSEIGISVQPATLVDILGPDCDEPVLAVAQVWAELHDQVRKLV